MLLETRGWLRVRWVGFPRLAASGDGGRALQGGCYIRVVLGMVRWELPAAVGGHVLVQRWA